MIVPMKKVSLIVLKKNKEDALNKLRKLGLLHIEITEGEGTKLLELKEQTALLEKWDRDPGFVSHLWAPGWAGRRGRRLLSSRSCAGGIGHIFQ